MINGVKSFSIRILKIILGFFIIGIGNALMIKADLGMNAWNTLDQGISILFNVSFGEATRGLGIIIIIFDILLGMLPGFGTIFNILCIGFFTDSWLSILDQLSSNTLIFRFVLFLSGTIIAAIGSGFYMSMKLGTGPRDGFSLILSQRLNFEYSKFRIVIELITIFLGFLLGATVGIGTIITALINGPIIGKTMSIFNYNPAKEKQENVFETLKIHFTN